MIKKVIRGLFAAIGAFAGYGTFKLVCIVLSLFGVNVTKGFPYIYQQMVAVVFAIIFGFIFFKTSPAMEKQSKRLSNYIGRELQDISASDLVSAVIGLITGLVISRLITQMFSIITLPYVHSAVVVATYIVFCYMGVVVGLKKGRDLFESFLAVIRTDQNSQLKGGKKKQGLSPKIFDTSVIIDGRIAEIMETGFIEGPIVIPEFVLVELRHIADSADSLKRTRGRHGLDILNDIRDKYGVEIYNSDKEKALKQIPEVDVKLLKLAQILNGKVVTNDYNLNKVAGINGVSVLNINELANCLKPVRLPGEKMSLTLVKQGKEPEQAVGYLNDGTMIVVEDGRGSIGKTTDIVVTSVLQTSAGRMIFGRLDK